MASSGAHTELVLAGLLFSVAVLVTAARVLAVPYPIFLVLGGLAIGFLPGIPNVELEPDLVLLLFLPPLLYSASFFTGLQRPAPEHPADRDARDRARARDRAGGRGRRPRGDRRHVVARRVRARRDRLAHRSRRRHRDRRPRRHPAPDRDGRRGRGADQRRDRARRLQGRGRGRAHRLLQRLGGGRGVPLLRPRRRRARPRHRLGDRPGPRAPRRPAGRAHDRAVLRLRRLPAGRGARALRRHRRRRDRALHGLADLTPDQLDRPHAGRRDLADHHLPAQLVPVPADRVAAPDDPRRPPRRRPRHRRPARLRRRHHRDGDRHPHRLDLRLPVLAVLLQSRGQPAAEGPHGRDRGVDGHARSGLARRRARPPHRHGRRRAASPSAR